MRPELGPFYWPIAVLLCAIILALACLLPIGHAMTLEIQGHSAGQGLQNLSFAGDLLNVSIAQNGSAWNVTLGGQL